MFLSVAWLIEGDLRLVTDFWGLPLIIQTRDIRFFIVVLLLVALLRVGGAEQYEAIECHGRRGTATLAFGRGVREG